MNGWTLAAAYVAGVLTPIVGRWLVDRYFWGER